MLRTLGLLLNEKMIADILVSYIYATIILVVYVLISCYGWV